MVMKNIFRAAAAVFKVKPGDCEKNADSIINAISRLGDSRPDAIVFGKNAIEGNGLGFLYGGDSLESAVKAALSRVVEFSNSVSSLIFIGHTIRFCGTVYSVISVLLHGRIIAMISETALPVDTIEFLGQSVPVGTDIPIITSDNIVISTVSGDDLVKVYPDAVEKARRSHILIMPMSLNYYSPNDREKKHLLGAAAIGTAAGIAVCSLGFGESTSGVLKRGLCAFAESGHEIHYYGQDRDDTVEVFDFDIDIIQHDKRMAGFAGKLSGGVYVKHRLSKKATLNKDILKNPFQKKPERLGELYERLAYATAGRLNGSGLKSAVIGLSGGVDSTLALFITISAFDKLGYDTKDIHAVSLPGMGTSTRTRNNSKALMDALPVSGQEIDISESIVKHFFDIGHDTVTQDVVYENAQARERTQVLLDLANAYNALEVGTGDLSESALGFCTFGGDNLCGFNPNASVTKTQARQLLRYLVTTERFKCVKEIVDDILDTPISPELTGKRDASISQKTEDIVGKYEVIDFYLYYFLRYGLCPEKLLGYAQNAFENEYDKEYLLFCLKSLLTRFVSSSFKRHMSEGALVSRISLLLPEFNIPSDLSFNIYLKNLEEL